MAIVRRSLGLGAFLLSILGLTVCLAVIVGVWMVKARVEVVTDIRKQDQRHLITVGLVH